MDRASFLNTAEIFHSPIANYWIDLREANYEATQTIQTRFERICSQAPQADVNSGDKILAQIRETFHNGLGIHWGEDQIRVFNAFCLSCLPLIYGNTWKEHKARVLKEWDVQKECPFTVVNMARRNGKTFSTSGAVVSVLLCIPNVKIAIFSTCKRTSQMMMSAVVDMLDKAINIGTAQDFTEISRNMESIIYEGPDKTKRQLGCFPGSVRTTRGTGADVIIIDEAAHIDPKLFFKTILPILAMKNTSLMCLSSPEGDDNYYSQLMNLKDEESGEPFFQVINCFQICPRCLKLEREKQIKCTHVKSSAHWLSSRKTKKLKMLYKANPEDAIREFGGIVVSDHLPALRKEEVQRAFTMEPMFTSTPPPCIFTCCDPTGGGPSMLSIASGYYTKMGDLVVRYKYSACATS